MGYLIIVGEKAHDATRRVLVSVHEPAHQPNQTSGHHRRPSNPWLNPGEVADGDGDAGDGGEAKIVEGAEISDNSGEGRVPI